MRRINLWVRGVAVLSMAIGALATLSSCDSLARLGARTGATGFKGTAGPAEPGRGAALGPGDPVAGEATYLAGGCGTCHRAGGIGPDIRGESAASIAEHPGAGREHPVSFPNLTQADFENLAAFLAMSGPGLRDDDHDGHRDDDFDDFRGGDHDDFRSGDHDDFRGGDHDDDYMGDDDRYFGGVGAGGSSDGRRHDDWGHDDDSGHGYDHDRD